MKGGTFFHLSFLNIRYAFFISFFFSATGRYSHGDSMVPFSRQPYVISFWQTIEESHTMRQSTLTW
jgi:hypothetical protein